MGLVSHQDNWWVLIISTTFCTWEAQNEHNAQFGLPSNMKIWRILNGGLRILLHRPQYVSRFEDSIDSIILRKCLRDEI